MRHSMAVLDRSNAWTVRRPKKERDRLKIKEYKDEVNVIGNNSKNESNRINHHKDSKESEKTRADWLEAHS